jgi:hypothetical protein
MYIYDFLNLIIEKKNYESYLEIGVCLGRTFRNIKCKRRLSVDPKENEYVTHVMTSNDFFKENKNKFDLIFVDGLHVYEQVKQDILNSLECLNENGIIIAHDTFPKNEYEERYEYIIDEQELIKVLDKYKVDYSKYNVRDLSAFWMGNVWKSILDLQLEDNDLEFYALDKNDINIFHSFETNSLSCGVTVIRRGVKNKINIIKPENLDYEFFRENCQKILNLVTYDEIVNTLNL